MTARELILALAELPPDATVLIRDSEYGDCDVEEPRVIDGNDGIDGRNAYPDFIRICSK